MLKYAHNFYTRAKYFLKYNFYEKYLFNIIRRKCVFTYRNNSKSKKNKELFAVYYIKSYNILWSLQFNSAKPVVKTLDRSGTNISSNA